MFSTQRLIVLGYLIVSIVGFSAQAKSDTQKILTPFNHSHIHDVLKEVRARQATLTKKGNAKSFLDYFPIRNFFRRPLSFNFNYMPREYGSTLEIPIGFMTPYLMVEGGISDSLEDAINIEDEEESSRVNFIIGNLYTSSFYMRLAHDYIPLGRHVSEAVFPRDMVTRTRLQKKVAIGEIASRYLNNQGQWQASVFWSKNSIAMITTHQHSEKRRIPFGKRIAIKNYLIGLGVGGGYSVDRFAALLNLYGEVHFTKKYQSRFEYVYDNFSHYHETSRHAFHIELSKYFRQCPITRVDIPSVLIVGYELGARFAKFQNKDTLFPQANLFGAYKLKFYKERIILLLGVKWKIEKGSYQDRLQKLIQCQLIF